MSFQRLFIAPLLALVLAGSLLPASAFAVDFSNDCDPGPKDHCLATERDNLTVFVDTDGSMNGDSGQNVDGVSGTESYWEAMELAIEEFANDNHNDGDCKDAGSCKTEGCDGVRIGVGFFGDDSASHTPPPGFNAYQPMGASAGDDRRDPVNNAIDAESAGNTGNPGIETLRCPVDGTGQVDVFSCPTMGAAQAERIWCPVNGGLQADEIGCPPMGVAKQYRIGCPPNEVNRTGHVQPTAFAPATIFAVSVDGTIVSYLTPPLTGTPLLIATGLYLDAIGNPTITSDYTVTLVGTDVRFTRITPGVDFNITGAGCWNCNIGKFPPPDISGLPNTPSPDHDFEFRINGNTMTYAGGASETTTSVCNGLRDAVNASAEDVNATVSGSTLILTSSLPGKDFSVSNIDSSLTDIGQTVANVPGLPGNPEAAKEFDFRVNGTKVAHDHIGALETTTNVCDELVIAVNNSGEDVSAVRIGDRLRVTSTVAGQSFNISSVDGDLTDYGTVVPNGPGLPGDPGAGHVYSFDLNGTTISHTGTATSSQNSVCQALHDAVAASAEPVIVSLHPAVGTAQYIQIQPQNIGRLFTVNNVDGELTRQVVLPGVSGLPGTPGLNHDYEWDYTDVDGNTVTLSAPTDATPTTAEVCSSIVSTLTTTGDFIASTTGTSVTVTPAEQGATWTFSNIDPALGHTTSIGPNLPNNPGPYHDYTFDVNGVTVSYTDDGSPTRNEICNGVRAAINSTVGGTVTATYYAAATPDYAAGTIEMIGTTPAAFDVENIDSGLLPHVVVQEAGQGPSAYGDLAKLIFNVLNIPDREQNAVVITHRGPENKADFDTAVTELCRRRNDAGAPAITHFIGVDVTPAERALLNALAAAGGSGSCTIDPCLSPTTVVNASMGLLLSGCSGAINTSASGIKSKLYELVKTASCTLDLAVPPTYPGGEPPNTSSVIRVEIKKWDNVCSDPPVTRVGETWWWRYWGHLLYVDHCVDDWSSYSGARSRFDRQGWDFAPGDRSKITFTDEICQTIRDGDIREIETHVGCQCANQGDECTAAFALQCKSQFDGPCNTVSDCTFSGTNPACVAGQCMQDCTTEQLAAMRCATGVVVCDDGVEECTAAGDNSMPEICNGIDDDCDGIVDNVSNAVPADFGGADVQGRNCNFNDTCMCPPNPSDISSVGNDIDDHLATWSGDCICGEALEVAYSEAYEQTDAPPEGEAPLFESEQDTACSIAGTNGSGGGGELALIGLVAALWMRRRRR